MNGHVPGLLGKQQATVDHRDIRFAAVSAAVALPKVPGRFGHASMYRDWWMLGNGPDPTVHPGFGGAGDCVVAGAMHETRELVHLGGHPAVQFTGKNAIDDYSAGTGYVLDDPSTDYGTNVRDFYKYRQKVGVVDALGQRHKIGAYVALDPKNWDQLMQAVYIFGFAGIGFAFPESAWAQFANGEPWDPVAGTAAPTDGHYVPVMGRSSTNVAGCVTWGRRQPMTRSFYEQYNDETWTAVSLEELRAGKNERGFDLTALNQALLQLRA